MVFSSSARTAFAGEPTIRLPGAKVLPSVTSAPAPTMQSYGITALLSMIAPMPISARSPTLQP